jgi:dephospho-CoA kinase
LILIGLTGGIASGKSTVAKLLEAKGAQIIDADVIAREVVEPDEPAYQDIVERFGRGVVASDGSIDRAALGEIVFADDQARRDLESITWPRIYQEISRRLEEARHDDGVVVLDAALLVESSVQSGDRGRDIGLDALVVVAAKVEDQIERLANDRKMPEDQARARMAAQAAQEKKLALADYVLDNRGSLKMLERNVEVLWDDLIARFGK